MTGQAALLQLLRRAPVTAYKRRIDVTDAAPVVCAAIDNSRRFHQHPRASGERGRHEQIAVALLISATS